MSDSVEQFVARRQDDPDLAPEVVGNARLTAALGALLLVGLFVEGLTLVMGVDDSLVLHVFVGFLVLPPILVKIGSTGYRMVRYYRNDPRYTHKGPPPPILRVIGPLVVLSTISLLATGIALLAVGHHSSLPLGVLHKLSFIAWFGLMTIHVLGHLVETFRLSRGDWTRRGPRVVGAGLRRGLVVGSVAAGLLLGGLSVGWTHSYAGGRTSRIVKFGGR